MFCRINEWLGPSMNTMYRALPISFLFVGTCTLLFCVGNVNPETFTSLASLKTLVSEEEWLLDQLDAYLDREQERLKTVKRRMDQISKELEIRKDMTDSDWDEYVSRLVAHPLDAFYLIKSWFEVTQMTSGASADIFESVTEQARQRGISLPESLDYRGGIVALARLQKTYKLPTDDLARGVVYNISAAQTLDHKDYMEMGKVLKEMDHSLAITWFEKLLEESNDTKVQLEAHLHRKDIYKQCGDYERALLATQHALELDPQNEALILEHRTFMFQVERVRLEGDFPVQHYYWKSAKHQGLEHYEALCRGDKITNDITVNKDLMCIYRTGILPYIRYKEEIHSFDPRISLFIDIISDRQADMLKAKAFPALFRAHVGDPAKSVTSDERVSKLAWLWDTDEEVKHISQNVGDVTGLDIKYSDKFSSAEAFQIVNYGLGGQYEPHFDFYEETEFLDRLPSFILGTGDRIATFMFYLSDVKAGGATVFPNIGVRVPPIQNAAAFWYNFPLSGESGDRRTLHAGCPVLMGQKWVGNKWIREGNQLFKRPCGLSQHQVHPIWYT